MRLSFWDFEKIFRRLVYLFHADFWKVAGFAKKVARRATFLGGLATFAGSREKSDGWFGKSPMMYGMRTKGLGQKSARRLENRAVLAGISKRLADECSSRVRSQAVEK